ncbi:MAG: hypothetical protein MI974_14815 [Chitinophagales bacterium]|nr:hypothetical protein [Chitinophagales bacterium]
MKYKLLLLFFCLEVGAMFGQDLPLDSLAGTWRGIITQNEGGFASEYSLEFQLEVDGNKISGKSLVRLEEIHATMILEGEIIGGNTISFKELRIEKELSREGMEWCYKSGFLIFSRKKGKITLEGPWSGKTADKSPCIPGEIKLQKSTPRA